jgi:hypothetical protein
MDEKIHESQTAYLPGRNAHNNLRSLKLIKQLCKQQKMKVLLIGVDATKAFDRVNHNYLFGVLEACRFGPKFISWVKVLNKDLKAGTLVNGFRTAKINIEQSVEQGAALSCYLFILFIGPSNKNNQ